MTLQEKLQANTSALFNSIDSIAQSQAQFKPSSTSWSILECVEHVFLVNVSVSKNITILAPEKIENDKTELFGEGKLNHLLVNKRDAFKVIAPEFASPKGKFITIEDAKQNITSIINEITNYILTHPIEQETHSIKHFRLGEMTKVDWIHFLISHTNRHILQIEEVKKLGKA